jgi:hypothetical protein
VDELASQQLDALARVVRLLDRAGIDHWLFGGWAADFWAGAVTRPHGDVDLAVWLDDVPRLEALLRHDGWHHAPHEGEDGGTGYERDAVRLELTYLVRDRDARICIPLRDGPAPWPEGAFGTAVGELRGVRARLVGREALAATESA